MSEESRNRAARYRIDPDAVGTDEDEDQPPRPPRRPEDQTLWVDQQIRAAMARGEFDDLPYAGKPLPHIDTAADPDWWLRQFIERENITGVLPEALQLRKDDTALDLQLDALRSEKSVRTALEDFNRRVLAARRQLQGGPPVVTPPRDVEAEVAAWRERRAARLARPATVPPTRPDRRDDSFIRKVWDRLRRHA